MAALTKNSNILFFSSNDIVSPETEKASLVTEGFSKETEHCVGEASYNYITVLGTQMAHR